MPFITREDGEHFVIPSYRDVLTAKSSSALKKEILSLSKSYGEYITLSRKSTGDYDVAFSGDTGYLLGESIWNYLQRPVDMVYCEAVPNTTEAILVIVKGGSVYLDGSFPTESIPEELVIFLTQQNNFEIYTFGDVPITQTPHEGKFSFEEKSVKSFVVLDHPVFPSIPLLKEYQLQLVDQILKKQGIGALPTKYIVMGVLILAVVFMGWKMLTGEKAPPPTAQQQVAPDPYEPYYEALNSSPPDEEITSFLAKLPILFTMPGWYPVTINYASGNISASVKSRGTPRIQTLLDWADENKANVTVTPQALTVSVDVTTPAKRPRPTDIHLIRKIVPRLIDQISGVYQGNHLIFGAYDTEMGLNQSGTIGPTYTVVPVTVGLDTVSPILIGMIGDQFKGLPFVLKKITMDVGDGSFSGSINFDILGK